MQVSHVEPDLAPESDTVLAKESAAEQELGAKPKELEEEIKPKQDPPPDPNQDPDPDSSSDEMPDMNWEGTYCTLKQISMKEDSEQAAAYCARAAQHRVWDQTVEIKILRVLNIGLQVGPKV